MMKAIDDFGTELMSGGDVGLFYYAGYGVQHNGKNYMIPVKAAIEKENELQYKAVDAGIVLAKMENARNRLNIVIMDACRDNPFARSFRSASQGLAYMDAPTGTIIAYATAPGKTAADGSGANGLYTSELIRYMKEPGLGILEMFMKVRREVRTKSGDKQIPWESKSLEGNFYFNIPDESTPPKITAYSGAAVVERPQLPPEKTTLTIICNVSAASVWINGQDFGQIREFTITSPGTYTVKVTADCYQPYQTTVDMKLGRSQEVKVYLDRIAAVQPIQPVTPVRPQKQITNSIGQTFVYIEPGTFTMGSPKDEPEREDDETQHQVTLTKGFYMQTTEVTVGQWRAFANDTAYQTEAEKEGWAWVWTGKWEKKDGTNWKTPGFNQTDTHPVTCISWNDAMKFIKWLSQKDRAQYRLPTEAEWEYAARAGSTTAFSFGNCLSTDQANYNGNYPLSGCSKGKFREKTVPVGSFPANTWGLYDMHGNVWEWCHDNCNWDSDKKSVITDTYRDNITDPLNTAGSYRVIRGGSWSNNARYCRSANRNSFAPGSRDSNVGFRLSRTP